MSSASRQFNQASSAGYEELTRYERATLRARARWLKSNNPIMANVDKSLINNTTRGMYIRFDDEKIRELFDEWAKKTDKTGRNNLYEQIDLITEARFVDGESFVYKSYDKHGLKLKIFESEQIDDSKGVNGLELDADGKVLAYWVYNSSTRDNFGGFTTFSSSKISADRIINFYRQERESQYRGVTEYARAIFDIKNMSAFLSTSIESMRARAGIAYTVKAEQEPKSFGVNSKNIQEINGAMVHYLNVGESISALDAPTTPINFREFITTGMRSLCVARQVSYEFGFRDFSNVNFTSSRAGKIEDNKTIDAEQLLVRNKLINVILEEFFRVEYLRGNVKSHEVPKHNIIFPIREWVRPLEDLEYRLTLIEEGVSTKEALCRQTTGNSYRETLVARKEELEMENEILGDYRFIESENHKMLLKDLKERRLLQDEEESKSLMEESRDEN